MALDLHWVAGIRLVEDHIGIQKSSEKTDQMRYWTLSVLKPNHMIFTCGSTYFLILSARLQKSLVDSYNLWWLLDSLGQRLGAQM